MAETHFPYNLYVFLSPPFISLNNEIIPFDHTHWDSLFFHGQNGMKTVFTG